ncbi:MAG: restriction endonuclease [Thaumarchaeota archaeon]|nr:restriction endonuclease [Nitrososphaerota archaeon]
MNGAGGGLYERLVRRCGSIDSAVAAVQKAAGGLAVDGSEMEVLAAVALVGMGVRIENVSEKLSWRDFEHFCAAMLRGWGYSVQENVVLTNPRAQIDIIARTSSMALVVDCKHWAKDSGISALTRVVEAQKLRARLARAKMKELEPTAVAIFVLCNEPTRFLNGAAIVPAYTLSDFLSNLPLHQESLSYF